MKVTVLGASGFVGRALGAALQARGDEVRAVSLRDPARAAEAASGSDVVVNLAGAPVVGRWTENYKREIAHSRDFARPDVDAQKRCDTIPGCLRQVGIIEEQRFVVDAGRGIEQGCHDLNTKCCGVGCGAVDAERRAGGCRIVA